MNARSPELVCVVPTLYGGGAEAAMARMATWWADRGVCVHVLTFFAHDQDYPLPPSVRRVLLNDIAAPQKETPCPQWPNETDAIARIRTALKTILAQNPLTPLPVLSFLPRMNMRVLLAARGLPCRVIIGERSFPPRTPLSEQEEALRRRLYPNAAGLVVQTQYCAQSWAVAIAPPERCHVIPNFCRMPSETDETSFPELPAPYFLAVGRLAEEKRHDLCLSAFARIAETAHFALAGSGPMESRLRAQAEHLGIAGRVVFMGHVAQPQTLMRHAYALTLSSDFEGFPNVLLESMACGCPVIATDCAAGPGEIVRHGVDGLLVPPGDASALANAMETLLRNPDLRNHMAERARDVTRRFPMDAIMRRWTTLLNVSMS